MQKIVLGYSGGLDSSVAIRWLAERHGAEVVTVTLDLGQSGELDDARGRALAIGAARAHVIDARDEFSREFIRPALQAGALRGGRDPMAMALGRPLIARHLASIARIEDASAIAHAGAGLDVDRFAISLRAVDPRIGVIAPAGTWALTRADRIAYARARGIPVPADAEAADAADENLWGRSAVWGGHDDLWQESPEDGFVRTKAPAGAPDRAAYVNLAFERGVPVSINDVAMPLVELIQCLETIASTHGVGRIDLVPGPTGSSGRTLVEAPAAVALHVAHRELQRLVTPEDLDRLASNLALAYADLVHDGRWFSATREAIDAFVANIQERVSGAIRLKLFKGDCRVVGRMGDCGNGAMRQWRNEAMGQWGNEAME